MDLLTEPQKRLLTASAVLVGGTVCGGPLGAIAASVAGGIVANDIVPQHLNHIAVRLRRSGDQLANHDLTEAVGFAIALIIKSIAEAGTYPGSKRQLESLAKYTLSAWREVAQDLKLAEETNFDPIQETAIAGLFRGDTADYVGQAVLTKEDWHQLLNDWLCPAAGVTLRDHVLQEVAGQLREKFALALREVLKADFEEGGKAFAGLTLSLLGEMRGILQELAAGNSGTRREELNAALAAVTQLRQELQGNSERFRALGGQIESGFEAVLQGLEITQTQIDEMRGWLQGELGNLEAIVREGFETVSQQNEQLQEAVATGFETVIGFLEREKPGVQAISFSLDTNPPNETHWRGRVEELSTVNGWLDDENTKLGVIVGMAGMGKSTLAAKVFRERTDFEDKLWLDLGRRPLYSIVARGVLQQLGKLSPPELEQIEETRLTDVLVHCLQRRRFLLVLDNLESVLEEGEYREFLQRWVGDCHDTEILVTTQVVPNLVQVKPTELELPGLSATEGAQLLRDLGVGGRAEELEDFVTQVNGHPLTLQLVAGLLNDELEDGAIGDLAGLGVADVGALMSRLQGLHRREVVQLVAVLDASFNLLSEKLRGVVLSLVALRQSFDADVASAIAGEAVTAKELRGLKKRGFLVAEAGGYTFVPLIWDYLKFKAGDLRAAHLRAIQFYLSRLKSRDGWETVEDVREYLEVFYHWCELGEYEAAFDIIRNPSYSNNCVTHFLDLRGKNQLLAELYQQLIEDLPNPINWRYNVSLISLGNACYFLGRHTEAIALYEQSLNIQQTIGDRRGEAAALGNLGNAYKALGRYEEAIAFYEQSLEIAREIGDRGGEANSLGNLGASYNALGRYEEAIEFYEKSLKIQRKIRDRGGVATSLIGLGNAYNSFGEHGKAIDFYKQSLEIQQAIRDRREEAISLSCLGNAYNVLGCHSEAIAFLEQSLEIARELESSGEEAESLIGLGSAYDSLGKHEKAIAFYEQSLEIQREIGDKVGEAVSLGNLGIAYHSLGKHAEAIAFHKQSLEIQREIGYRGREATVLNNLGETYDTLEDYQKSLALYQQSLKISEEIKLQHLQAITWYNLGKTLTKCDRIPDAIGAYRNARQLYQQLQLEHKIAECDTAIQQLETPPPQPSPLTPWQKLRQLYRRFVQFIRNLFS